MQLQAEATISTYRANPVQNIQQLLDYPDPDKTIQGFLTKFRNAFLQSIPDTLDSNVDKRKLIKNIKSLYRTKLHIELLKYFLNYYLMKMLK